MRKLSDIIKENESNKEYKYTATVNVEGKVIAASEGEAGALVDKEMDVIPGMINYEINLIEDATGIGENKVNENINTNVIGNFQMAYKNMVDTLPPSDVDPTAELYEAYMEFENKIKAILHLEA